MASLKAQIGWGCPSGRSSSSGQEAREDLLAAEADGGAGEVLVREEVEGDEAV
jgi:hypothetical protein